MQKISPNVIVSIVLAVAMAIAAGILLLRDRWRDQVGMPAAERRRVDENATSRFLALILFAIGMVFLVKFLRGLESSHAWFYGISAVALLWSSYVSLRRIDRDGGSSNRDA